MEKNKTLRILAVESNFLSGDYIVQFIASCTKNNVVNQLHLANQVSLRSSEMLRPCIVFFPSVRSFAETHFPHPSFSGLFSPLFPRDHFSSIKTFLTPGP